VALEEIQTEQEEEESCNYTLFLLVESKPFNIFIIVCILLNTCFLGMDRYPISKSESQMIDYANLAFYIIFLIEMILKLIGYGVRGYCKDSFNLFDGTIVILSTIEIIMNYTRGGSATAVISAFRAFRLLRVFKLAKSWTSLRNLLNTIRKTLFDVAYFSILLLLFMFIYALLGMELYAYRVKFDRFDQVDLSDGTSPRENFDDFVHAFIMIFAVLVGDDWQISFYRTLRCEGASAIVFFVTLIIFGNVILLNLFLAVLLGNFETDPADL
jgi:voltage-dependent calcium channel L type alpha-1D